MPKCSVKDTNGKIYTLYYNADSGDTNLTVGFYLEGPPDLIKYLKSWKFGDNTPEEKDHDIIKNHTYFRGSPSSCLGSVIVLDSVTEKPISPQINFTINVRKHQGDQPYISNFYQTEGVIFQDAKVGYSLCVQGITPDNIIWDWKDGQFTKGPLETHPSKQYSSIHKDLPVNGSVTVYGSQGNDIWEFCVMVLQDPTTLIGGEIDIQPPVWSYVNDEVIFLANLKNLGSKLNLPDGYAYHYQWAFETNPSNTNFDGKGEEGTIDWTNLRKYQTKHRFGTSENYRVIFTIYRNVDGKNKPYLCLSRSFNIRPKP